MQRFLLEIVLDASTSEKIGGRGRFYYKEKNVFIPFNAVSSKIAKERAPSILFKYLKENKIFTGEIITTNIFRKI